MSRFASPLNIDEISVPAGVIGNEAVDFLASYDFDKSSFDYELWTDGSGHHDGYGAAASIWRHRDGVEDICVQANYGQTVARNEFMALLDGLQAILSHAVGLAATMRETPKNPLLLLSGADRPTIAWYTDRQNLALSLVYRDDHQPVYARNTERDLWARYAFMSRHCAIVPYYAERNTVANQGVCDKLCGILRTAIKQADAPMKIETIHLHNEWHQRPQKATM